MHICRVCSKLSCHSFPATLKKCMGKKHKPIKTSVTLKELKRKHGILSHKTNRVVFFTIRNKQEIND